MLRIRAAGASVHESLVNPWGDIRIATSILLSVVVQGLISTNFRLERPNFRH